jgi:hypothetical protein
MGGTKTYSKKLMICVWWDMEGILRAPTTQQNHKFRSLLSTIGPSKRMTQRKTSTSRQQERSCLSPGQRPSPCQ